MQSLHSTISEEGDIGITGRLMSNELKQMVGEKINYRGESKEKKNRNAQYNMEFVFCFL